MRQTNRAQAGAKDGPAGAGPAGGSAGADPDALLNRGMQIIGQDLERIGAHRSKEPLPVDQASALAGYVRVLSAIRRDRSAGRGGAGRYAGMDVAQLKQQALADPVLAEVLADLGIGVTPA